MGDGWEKNKKETIPSLEPDLIAREQGPERALGETVPSVPALT